LGFGICMRVRTDLLIGFVSTQAENPRNHSFIQFQTVTYTGSLLPTRDKEIFETVIYETKVR